MRSDSHRTHSVNPARGLWSSYPQNILAFIHPSADRIAQLIPNAQRKTLPSQTHQVAPEAVTPLLVEFFGEGG